MTGYSYEIGPIRPPSEAPSLLLRVTRNCQWNRCQFCPVYKDAEFSVRKLEHILQDIDYVREYSDFL
ncbi:MAG: radical SAM protein, partial [Candidatus Thorarchaeota archaeon]